MKGRIFKILPFFAALLSGLFVFCACSEAEAHEHIYENWTVETPATCTENGAETSTCTVCGRVGRRSIGKTGHDFTGEPKVVQEATCKEGGILEYSCKNGCGATKQEPTARREHDFSGEETVKNATCTKKGERRVKCLYCDEESVTYLSALNHAFDEGTVTKKATCEEAGEILYTCTREGCGETKKETVKALEHRFGEFTVDKPSSLTEDGQKSRHCTREGCGAQKDITVLPKGENVEYTVKAVRKNGMDYPFASELKVGLYDGQGQKVGDSYPMQGGKADFTIKDAPYRVVLEGLRPGFVQTEAPTLSRDRVDLSVEVASSMVQNPNEAEPASLLKEGEPMHDFLVRDVNTDPKDYKMLSELMKGKKGAYLFFFYVGCGQCASQLPVFVERYNALKEKDDLLVLMINVYSDSKKGQTAADMREYKKRYPEEFLMMSGQLSGTNLYDWAWRPYDGVPFSYFLDFEGVIDTIVPADNKENLKKIYDSVLSRYFEEGYTAPEALPAEAGKQREA